MMRRGRDETLRRKNIRRDKYTANALPEYIAGIRVN